MESIDFNFQGNEITDKKKKKNILSSCGHKTFLMSLDIIVPDAL